ncbi:DUF6612 family protein [Paenibacillus hodogayensis]|uniref:DUF6612 family protein n=1 Tax=Paenibacillus hodogayensis TaxID=279208 RepID=A0ABV5VS56_9BACL
MKKSLPVASAALLALALTATSVSAADAAKDTPVTRGQFMKQVADYLQLSPQSKDAALPSDVGAQSEYAAPVRALIERHIIDGYPDGTFRPDQPITQLEAGYILARFLGLDDNNALTQLESKFGIRFADATLVLPDAAQQAIRTSLQNDAKVLEWLKQSSLKQAGLKTYKVDMEQVMNMRLKDGAAEAAGLGADGLRTSAKSSIAFDMEKGMHMITHMTNPVPGASDTLEMEQYIVPEGSFMKMPGITASGGWVNMSKQMPFSFEQLMQLQKDSASMNQALLQNTFFYRDLGTEQVDGKTLRKIAVNGKIHDFKQIMTSLGSSLNDASFSQMLESGAEELKNMSLSMNGTLWLDDATQLTTKTELSMNVAYGATEAMPLEGMDMTVSATYSDYDKPVQVVLPEEAKKAPELADTLPIAPDAPNGPDAAVAPATK